MFKNQICVNDLTFNFESIVLNVDAKINDKLKTFNAFKNKIRVNFFVTANRLSINFLSRVHANVASMYALTINCCSFV